MLARWRKLHVPNDLHELTSTRRLLGGSLSMVFRLLAAWTQVVIVWHVGRRSLGSSITVGSVLWLALRGRSLRDSSGPTVLGREPPGWLPTGP